MEEKKEVKITKKTLTTVEKIVKKLMSLLEIEVGVDVSHNKKDDAVYVKIDAGDETGLLIGGKGETIFALQTVIGMSVKQKTGEWTRVVVDVANWREKQEDKLKRLTDSTVDRVVQTGESQPLYNLSAADRRIIHMYLADSGEVETESIGEGRDRYLLIKSKQKD